MLEALRRQSQSWLIWVALGIIIIVFVFFFGPQAGGFDPSKKTWAAKVRGSKIYNTELEAAVDRTRQLTGRNVRGDEYFAVKRDVLLDIAMVHLLADEARSEGLRIADDELSCYIVNWNQNYKLDGEYICRKFSRSYQQQYPNFDYMFYSDPQGNLASDFDGSVRRWFQLSGPAYEKWKEHELLAFHYLDILAAGLPVDQASIEAFVARRANKIDLEYIRLAPPEADAESISDATIDEFLASHRDDVEAYYGAHRDEFTNERQIRLRRIAIRKPSNEDSEEFKAAKQRYESVLSEAQAEDADFEALVEQHTDFEQDKTTGGDMGLRAEGNISAGLWDAAAELEVGEVTGVEQGFAWNIIKLEEDIEAGTQPLDDVERGIARTLILEQRQANASEQLVARGRTVLEYAKTHDVSLEDALSAVETPNDSAATLSVESTGRFSFEPAPPDLSGIDPQYRQFVQIQARNPGTVPGIGHSPALVAQAFQLTEEAPLITEPVEVDGVPYLVRLKERVEGEGRESLDHEVANNLRGALANEWFAPIRMRVKLVVHNGDPFAPALGDLLDRAMKAGDIEIREKLFPAEGEQAPAPTAAL